MAQISRWTKLEKSKIEITNYFRNNNQKFFTEIELNDILNENIDNWNLARVTKGYDFIYFLKNNNIIEIIKINLPNNSTTTRYSTGDYFDYEIGLSIYKNSYLSHYTALYLHNLTNNIPKSIYLNREQTKKFFNVEKNLKQESIDSAFKKPMRKTNQIATFKDNRIYMLNGKNTNNLGIIKKNINGKEVMISSIERTLIDIVVRPDYAGGPSEILKAYELAKDNCSINYLLSILKKLDYTYPYHQSIGFYLEKAGYKESILKMVEQIEQQFDFYLQYKIANKEYSKRWRLFYPKGI